MEFLVYQEEKETSVSLRLGEKSLGVLGSRSLGVEKGTLLTGEKGKWIRDKR